MKANGKFFGVMFVFNMILGLIGFLILWGIRALTNDSVIGIIVCEIIFTVFAVYINYFVVKRSKLKLPYMIYGTIINLLFFNVPTVLMMVL